MPPPTTPRRTAPPLTARPGLHLALLLAAAGRRRRRPGRRSAGSARRRPDAIRRPERRADGFTESEPDADADSLADADPDPGTDRPRCDRHVLRPRLRSRRRDVAVRRPRPGARRPERDDDPRPLLPRRDARDDPDGGPRSASASCTAGRRRRPCRSSSTAGARRGRSTASPRPSRPTRSCASSRRPRRRRPARTRPGGSRDRRPPAPSLQRPEAGQPRRPRGDRARPGSSCGRSRAHYDEFRGILRIRTSSTAPTVTVVNDLPLETYLRGVVPAEMSSAWPTAALEAQAIASRSYAARRLRPGVSYYDVPDDSSSQVYRGAMGEHATTNAIITATAGRRAAERIVDRQHALPLGRRRRDREQRERLLVVDRGQGRRRRSYLRGSIDRDATGRHTTRRRRTRPGRRRPTRARSCRAWFAADARTNVGTLTAHRPAQPRRLGPAHQRDPDRVGGDEDGSRATSSGPSSTPAGRAPTRCSAARSSRPRRSPDRRYRGAA